MPRPCSCEQIHPPRLVVVTGGPGAGKTAVLEVVQRQLCEHVVVLPEAASMLWRGGFPRRESLPARRSAQRAIARIQVELQRIEIEEGHASLILCDRGTLDGLAYWPGTPEEYFDDLGTTLERELSRYAAVIHLRTPHAGHGYNHQNPLRVETASEAAAIDERILAAWASHPRRIIIDSQEDFLVKLHLTLSALRSEMPACCRPPALAA